MTGLSHVGEDGRPTMVDVTGKAATDRTATAAGWLKCRPETLERVRAMEALTAVSVAGLTLFDMLKAVDREMEIGGIAVTSKTGGKSGDW